MLSAFTQWEQSINHLYVYLITPLGGANTPIEQQSNNIELILNIISVSGENIFNSRLLYQR